ncbi:MAG: Gldg family protein [Phormidesmis sp.]
MKTIQPLIKYLLWPGLTLVTAGLVVGLLNGWTLVAVALLVIGLMLLVASIAAGEFSVFTTRFWQQRSTQAGTNAAVSVFSVLLILGLVNFLGARYDSRTDLTEGQLLTLSPASQEVVQNLAQPAKVLIFSPAPNPTDQQLLENYRRFNRDLTYEYIDPFAQPQLAQEIGVETGGEVFLQTAAPDTESGERTLLVQRTSPEEPLSERQLTNKLAQLSQTDIAVVYFLQGHSEYAIDGSQAGFFEAATRLEGENFTVLPLNLAETGTVPDDANVVIIAGAQEKLFDAEVTAIRTYLEAGGSLFVLIDPQVETGLEVLMSQWGVVPEKTIVIDTSGGGQLVGLGPAAPLVTDYGDHPITEAFNQGRSFFPISRPLQIREVPNIEETPLLFTNQNSHAQTISEGDEIAVDTSKGPEGPFALGVALSRPAVLAAGDVSGEETPADTAEPTAADLEATEPAAVDPTAAESAEQAAETDELDDLDAEILDAAEADGSSDEADGPKDSRMVVIGNSSFATDGLFDQQLNGDVFLNSVSWLSQIDSPTLSIRPKEATNRRLNMTVQQQILLMLLALVIFPLLGLVGAGTLWARRR